MSSHGAETEHVDLNLFRQNSNNTSCAQKDPREGSEGCGRRMHLAARLGPRFCGAEDPILDERDRVHVRVVASLVCPLLEPLVHDIMAEYRRDMLCSGFLHSQSLTLGANGLSDALPLLESVSKQVHADQASKAWNLRRQVSRYG